jgi:hypothetical protein
MKALIICEGEHEDSGALEVFVRRLHSLGDSIVVEYDRLKRNDIIPLHGKGGGFFLRALRWAIQAQKAHYDVLILLVDEDREPDRIDQINRAQAAPIGIERRALGVAIHSFDAWILADEQALSTVLRTKVQCQPDPEENKNPKTDCKRLLADSKRDIKQRDMYADVAMAVDIAILKRRCPRGFAPFAERVESL